MATLHSKLLIEAARVKAKANAQILTLLHRGDPDSGQILLSCYQHLDQSYRLLRRERDWTSGEFIWVPLKDGNALSAGENDAFIDRQCTTDPDLWVFEFEGIPANHPFD